MANDPKDQTSAAALSAFKASVTTGTFKAIAEAAQKRNAIAATQERAQPLPDDDDEPASVRRPKKPLAYYRGGPAISPSERAAAIAEINRIADGGKARRDA